MSRLSLVAIRHAVAIELLCCHVAVRADLAIGVDVVVAVDVDVESAAVPVHVAPQRIGDRHARAPRSPRARAVPTGSKPPAADSRAADTRDTTTCRRPSSGCTRARTRLRSADSMTIVSE
jgi:hypothetical protein